VIDSITKAQEAREHALKITNDSLAAQAEYNQALADSFAAKAETSQERADKYKEAFFRAKASIHNDPVDPGSGCDTAIKYAELAIIERDSVIKLKNGVISNLSKEVVALSRQVDIQKQSAAGFKSDFMKLKTDVIPPLQSNLAEATKQWKRNRAGKKTFAGIAAVAIGVAIVESLKH
jgi:hypothetical protein